MIRQTTRSSSNKKRFTGDSTRHFETSRGTRRSEFRSCASSCCWTSFHRNGTCPFPWVVLASLEDSRHRSPLEIQNIRTRCSVDPTHSRNNHSCRGVGSFGGLRYPSQGTPDKPCVHKS